MLIASIRFLSEWPSPVPRGTVGLNVPLENERVSQEIISWPGMCVGSLIHACGQNISPRCFARKGLKESRFEAEFRCLI